MNYANLTDEQLAELAGFGDPMAFAELHARSRAIVEAVLEERRRKAAEAQERIFGRGLYDAAR